MKGRAGTLTIKIITPKSEIARLILKEILDRLIQNMDRLRNEIKVYTISWLDTIIKTSDTYQELLHGQLRKELGIENPADVLDAIMRVWLASVDVKYQRPSIKGKRISSLIEIHAINADFSDVKDLGSYISVSQKRGYLGPGGPAIAEYNPISGKKELKSYPIDWLSWLVERGDSIIVSNYVPKTGPFGAWSRTGDTIMVSHKSKSYMIPAKHSGKIGDNFVTRAIMHEKNQIEFEKSIEQIFYKVLQ